MTQDELSHQTGLSQSKIHRVEAASATLTMDEVNQVIDVLHVEPTTARHMRSLTASLARGVPYSGIVRKVPPHARRYMDAETVALEILSWHELRLPGPLQSEHYMLKQFGANPIDVAPLIRTRKHRRALFRRPDLRRYACVLAEEALHRAYHAFGRVTILDEIDYLLDLNDPTSRNRQADTRSSIHLLPIETGMVHLPPDFSIVVLPGNRGSFVYIEHVAGGYYAKSATDVQTATQAWQNLHTKALDRSHTNAFLVDLRKRFVSG